MLPCRIIEIITLHLFVGSSNLGSAVATSMNLTNSSEPIADGASVFKMESPHDLMYYQVSFSFSVDFGCVVKLTLWSCSSVGMILNYTLPMLVLSPIASVIHRNATQPLDWYCYRTLRPRLTRQQKDCCRQFSMTRTSNWWTWLWLKVRKNLTVASVWTFTILLTFFLKFIRKINIQDLFIIAMKIIFSFKAGVCFFFFLKKRDS